MILPLQQGILYGPIDSRRLGKSLGINLMPCNYKLCSFNCIYCHYGLTDILAFDISAYLKDLPKSEEVLGEIENAMRSVKVFDYVTFSGNGEPTLYPHFDEIVRGVVGLRDKYRPNVKIALLSNASGLKIEEVRKSLAKIDLPMLKLDAGTPDMFKQVNRPAKDVDYEEIIMFLKQTRGIHIQTVLMDGEPSNVGMRGLETYFERIARIKPLDVQIYSLDRPVPNKNIKRILPENLEKIARLGSKKTDVKFKAFFL